MRPDIVLPKPKLAANAARNLLVTRTLGAANWRVTRLREHALWQAVRTSAPEARLVRRIVSAIKAQKGERLPVRLLNFCSCAL